MLKIEVIKFEAQDVITTSVAAPEEDKPAEVVCTCKEGEIHHNYGEDWNHGNCPIEGDNNRDHYCNDYVA